ncbi:hypothetical protein RIF29_39274 [Crotalaria pallida]|uniref:Uncharacterized protein n=1 Tax=Crotalaria pallida TaxID=3830 RepID=A0AAN9E3C5_CROPI
MCRSSLPHGIRYWSWMTKTKQIVLILKFQNSYVRDLSLDISRRASTTKFTALPRCSARTTSASSTTSTATIPCNPSPFFLHQQSMLHPTWDREQERERERERSEAENHPPLPRQSMAPRTPVPPVIVKAYGDAKWMTFMDAIVVVKGRVEDVRSSVEELRTKSKNMLQLYLYSFL